MNKEELFEKGKLAFNSGQYFDAHEIWEEIWQELRVNKANSIEALQLQALIQISVALHLIHENRQVGAKKVLERAINNINKSNKHYRDIDLTSLYEQILSKLDENLAIERSIEFLDVKI